MREFIIYRFSGILAEEKGAEEEEKADMDRLSSLT